MRVIVSPQKCEAEDNRKESDASIYISFPVKNIHDSWSHMGILKLSSFKEQILHLILANRPRRYDHRKRRQRHTSCPVATARLSKSFSYLLNKAYVPTTYLSLFSLSIVDESVINYELIEALLETLCFDTEGSLDGAILVFLPGTLRARVGLGYG